jgi:hypothetical protein
MRWGDGYQRKLVWTGEKEDAMEKKRPGLHLKPGPALYYIVADAKA